MELKNNERIDDLQYKDLKIIQNEKDFCFGIDAVLLSDFAKGIKDGSYVVDLCTGNGIIAILISGKTKAKEIIGVEIQEHVAEMANRSVEMNNIQDRVKIINEDLTKLKDKIKAGTVDAITVNPPYKAKNSGLINERDTKTIARHEISCTLEDIIIEAARELKSSGNLYMIHKTERLVEIFSLMRKHKVEPKRIRFIHPNVNEAPNLVLVEGARSGRAFLKVEKPLYVYKENGEYTDDIKEIYGLE